MNAALLCGRGDLSLRRGITFAVALGALAVLPSVAAAAPRYVDAETGYDTDPTCPISAPCDTLTYAIANSAAGDEVLVDNGTYIESVTLGDGRSLRFDNFVVADGTGPAIVDGGASTAVTVPASGAGHIRDLTLRGDANGVLMNGLGEVVGNTFDELDAANAIGVHATADAADASIHDNTFVDPAPAPTRPRLGVYAPSSAVDVVDNSFAGFNTAVWAQGPGSGTTVVAGNEITGTHNSPGVGQSIVAGGTGQVVVRENTVSAASGTGAIGITALTGAALLRNEITGHETGVFVPIDATGVTLEGDRIWGNTHDGLVVLDLGPAGGTTSATATNVTLVENGSNDFRADSSVLTLDSSIVETPSWSGSASCTITFSRADAIGTDPTGCDGFQTTDAPMFVDAPNGDLHLPAASPMLDIGNPAAPVAAIDFDGDPRAVDATPECAGNVDRRDIGADEFAPAPIDCDVPATTIESGPEEGEAINEATPTFGFSSDDPGATFECDLNDAGFAPCSHTNQHILGPLGEGGYTFAVRAVDAADNEDPTPAERSFTVDLTAPETSFTKTPPRKSKRKRVTLGFEADEFATFDCRLDSRPAFDCDSPVTMRIKRGRHRFSVVGTDEAGNPDPTAATVRFRRIKR